MAFHLHFLRRYFSNDLSIDLGTANTLVCVGDSTSAEGYRVVLNAPSVVAIRQNTGGDRQVIAVGVDAKRMQGRTPEHIKVIRPLRDGVIADFEITKEMLQYFIRKVHQNRYFKASPRILICVPCGSTQVERRAIRESALDAGASEVYLIEEPMAAAIGAGLPVEEASGSMVVDIGGGTTEVAIVSLNGVVYSHSVRIGGDRFDEAIINYVRRHHGHLIGEVTAEKIKHQLGCAYDTKEKDSMEVRGRHVSEGIPCTFCLKNEEVLEALQEPLFGIVSSVRIALEKVPPELSADIAQRGVVLTGGGALLKDIELLLMRETGLPVIIANDPLTCVARGGGRALDLLKLFGGDFLTEE